MGFAVSLIITAVGFVLALAVHPEHPGSVNVNTVGWILVAVGITAFVIDLLLWSEWGPAYARHDTTVRRYRYRTPRRTIVEEEEVGGPTPPPGY